MRLSKEFRAGALDGVIFTYEKAGDDLPVHVHSEEDNHITVVMSGSFRCIGNHLIEGRILKTGAVVDWPVGEPHGFVALEDNSRMLQIAKGKAR